MSFLATTAGICGDDVRDRLVAAVESRFGTVNRLSVTIEWLSDNGSCYIAGDTRSFARDIGLEPRTTPIESPQSNGMAEAFVRTIKRDYVRVNPRPNAEAVLRQLPCWVTHYNEVHPHKALGYRSPHRNSRKSLTVSGRSGLQHKVKRLFRTIRSESISLAFKLQTLYLEPQ
jgi:putative transposase